jgi:Transposase and inactivated derivatives
MAMTNRKNAKLDSIILSTLNDLVPQNHLVRKIENCLDFNFIYDLVKPLYSSHGRPSIDPVVLFKMMFINIIFGVNSMRKTCTEIEVNVAYRWFLGLSVDEKIPNYSTFSQNYLRRYADSDVFEKIFDEIIRQAMEYNFIDTETVFGDSTHQKASANKNKADNKEVALVKKKYEDDLLKEINEDREMCGLKTYDTLISKELIYDENSGEVKEVSKTKQIKVSKTDSESGCYHKGEKEKCFAYSQQTFCDRKGFILSVTTIPGNIHDSASFFEAYKVLSEKYPNQIKNISLDAGYLTPPICKEIIDNNQTPYMPYKRPMTKKGYFKKYDYVYDEMYDCYICPNNKLLNYTSTNRDGYRQYKSCKEDCKKCELISQCTKSKNQIKVVARHIWEEYKEKANEIRHTPEWKEIYPLRKETIERAYAECKENHGLRFTRLRGLKKNQNNGWLIFGCYNLKKMGIWAAKHGSNAHLEANIIKKVIKKLNKLKNGWFNLMNYPFCQQSEHNNLLCFFLFYDKNMIV